MGSKTFNVVVVAFWFSTMIWLLEEKVLPPLWVGDPPSYDAILESRPDEQVAFWRIYTDDRRVGLAGNEIVRSADGTREVRSRVVFRKLPITDITSGWLAAAFIQPLAPSGQIDLDVHSRLSVDPLGRLIGFESRVRLADIPDAFKMRGEFDGAGLSIVIQKGDIVYRPPTFKLPPKALVGDELSPQSSLPGLRIGQKWTVPVYSPFRPQDSPMEILQAHVECQQQIIWDSQPVETYLVVYRGDSGSGMFSLEPRGKLWVRHDGAVLRQEVALFHSKMRFLRLSPRESAQELERRGKDWLTRTDAASEKSRRQLADERG